MISTVGRAARREIVRADKVALERRRQADGELALPSAILDLARPLNSRERAVVRSHTIRGAEILAEIAGLRYLAPLDRGEARRRIASGAGTAFDPRVVRALLDPL